jgi:hypothetical protein
VDSGHARPVRPDWPTGRWELSRGRHRRECLRWQEQNRGGEPVGDKPVWRCPRCEAASFFHPGEDHPLAGVESLVRSAEGRIVVCKRCSEREEVRKASRGGVIPVSEWPLPIDVLLEDERYIIEADRKVQDAIWAEMFAEGDEQAGDEQ